MLGQLKKTFFPSIEENWDPYRCYSCRRPFKNGMVFPEDRVSFCLPCFKTTPCFSCGLPCGPVHRRLSDDRMICQPCYSTALLTPRQLLPVYETTAKFLKKQLKLNLKDKPRLKVVDLRFLQKEFGCSAHTWGIYSVRGKEEIIYIISGISLDKAHTTLAHELTHFWQKRNCPSQQSLELSEGFAEWMAYRFAHQKNLERAMLSIRRNMAEPYRTGLQKLFHLEQRKGVSGVIHHAKRFKNL